MRLLYENSWTGFTPILCNYINRWPYSTERFWDAGSCRLRMLTSYVWGRLEIELYVFSPYTMAWNVLLKKSTDIDTNLPTNLEQPCTEHPIEVKNIEASMLELATMILDGL